MIRSIFLISIAMLFISGCGQSRGKKVTADNTGHSFCSDECMARTAGGALTCKLTSPELQHRRETVIASLKSKVIEKKELQDGYAYRFTGSDQMVDELISFIKSEREYCDFFVFNLSISGDKREAWLELTGVDGIKEFVSTELGF